MGKHANRVAATVCTKPHGLVIQGLIVRAGSLSQSPSQLNISAENSWCASRLMFTVNWHYKQQKPG